jgi:ATP-dependent Clp protease ATP-binding subunit ClpC
MHQDLTQSLRRSLEAAQASARELNQDFVSTEHLMLGILSTDGDGLRALRSAHAEPKSLKSALKAELPHGKPPHVVTGDLPLSPKAQRAINGAIVTAKVLQESHVSTRFLLKSLLEEPQSVLRGALESAGVDIDALVASLDPKPSSPES